MNGSVKLKTPVGVATVFGRTRETPALGTHELLAGYGKYPWIRAISDKIGQGIGSTEWWLSANGVEVENHPLLDLLRRPNPGMSGKAFFKWSGTHFALTNEIFWLIERNGVGMPIELWPIPASWVLNIPVMGNPDGQYEISFKGRRSFFPAQDIVYIRDFDPSNPYGRSSSPAKALGDEIESDEFAAKYVKSFFMNSARPDLLIYSEDKENPISTEDAKRLESSWLAKLQGFRKKFQPFFLPGKVGVKDLQSDLKSMDLVDQRKFWRDICLQVYAIPPEAMGIVESSNRATIAAAEFFLMKHVIVPRVEIIQDSIIIALASQFDTRLRIDFISPIQEDREHALNVSKAHPHAFTLDEIREQADLEPIDNNEGEIYPFQFNTMFSVTPGGGAGGGTPLSAPAPTQQLSVKMTTVKELSGPMIEDILLVVNNDDFVPGVKAANAEAVANFGQVLIDQVDVGISFDIAAVRVQEFLATQSSERITLANETTKGQIRVALAEGSAAGEGAAAISKRIVDIYEEARGTRAFRIARTETTRASNFGTLAGMQQVGIKQKQWFTVGDDNVRSTHQSLNGQTVQVNNAFVSLSGAQALYPGNFGVAEEDIECRCSILAVINPQASINIPSTKDFEQQRVPYTRLMEHAYVKGFDAQELEVIAAFNDVFRV